MAEIISRLLSRNRKEQAPIWTPTHRFASYPYVDEVVLVTAESIDGSRDVCKAYWTGFCWCTDDELAKYKSHIVAWMPLPEPYMKGCEQ